MIKVTLLGDSIRLIGYGKKVPALLGDGYDVFQPQENCRFAKYTLRGLWEWQDAMEGSRIVHWNNGLWDACDLFGDGTFSTEDEYVTTMLRIAKVLQERYETVIFATTTPVREAHSRVKNDRVERFNAILVPELVKRGVLINDLYRIVSQNVETYIRADDNIHLTDAGIDLCAAQVADVIRAAAGEPKAQN